MRCKRWIAVLSVCSMLLCAVSIAPASATETEGVDDMRAQIAALEEKAQELSENIASLRQDESKQQQLKTQLQRQISNTQEQIDLVNDEVMALNKNIDDLSEQIEEKEAALEEAKAAFKQRLRVMYMTGGNSELVMLLGSDDMADYLAKTELTRSVSKRDNALMEEIMQSMEAIRAAQAEIDADRSAKSAAQDMLTQKQAEMEGQIKEVSHYIDELDQQAMELAFAHEESVAAIEEYENQIEAALEAARQEAEREEAENDSSEGGSDEDDSGEDTETEDEDDGALNLLWPVKGFHNITSPYGWRLHPIYGVQRFHSGIDIADWGIHGEPVLAAEDGTISLASYNEGGYGYYVMVYHGTKRDGNDYATLYAHLDSYTVYEGQKVKKGDVIGYVGTTGASTGSHLHYEVRRNGETTDPVSYY